MKLFFYIFNRILQIKFLFYIIIHLFSFFLAEEELWSERNETKNVTEEALKSDISDGDEATKDSNTEERNKMAEEEDQNMADTNVKGKFLE